MLKLSERCQCKHVYTGAERQCENGATAKIRDRRTGDVYRVCAKHLRMALEGKVRPFAKVAPKDLRTHWARTGQVPPYKGRYQEHKPTRGRK